jgi:hypothetical protein
VTREDVKVREKALWRLLQETAARASEALSINVEDLELPARSRATSSSRSSTAAMARPTAAPPTTFSGLCAPRYTRATAFRIASTNATTAQRRGSTSASSPAMAKVMMACPETKLSPPGCTPRRIASPTVVPGRSRWTSHLTTRSRASLQGTTSTSAAARRQRRKASAPTATISGMASTLRYWKASMGPYSQLGSPLTVWKAARSMGPTRPSAAITAHTANTARLATSTMTSRRPRLTAPPLRRRLVGRPTRPHRQPTGKDRRGLASGCRSSFPSGRRLERLHRWSIML